MTVLKTLTIESEWQGWKTIREVYDEDGNRLQPVKLSTKLWRKDAVFEFRPKRRYLVIRKEWINGVRQKDAVFRYTVRERRDDDGNLLGYRLEIVKLDKT